MSDTAAQWPFPDRPPSGGPKIVVVDDDRGFREMLRDFLADEGFDVVGEAADGLQALELAATMRPDLFLMDLRMPNMDGIAATRMIREANPLMQVIILSAYDDPGLKRGAEEAGVYCYLIKDCAPVIIKETLNFAWRFKLGLEAGSGQDGAFTWADLRAREAEDPSMGFSPGA
jgi:DNA-binding NarL/FixJ family response regulator